MNTTLRHKTGDSGDIVPETTNTNNGTFEVFASAIEEKTRGVEHDDAAELFAGTGEVFQYTAREASRVRWKLDLILLVMVIAELSEVLQTCWADL